MTRLFVLTLLIALCQMDASKHASACGGPDYGNFGALAPLDASLGEILRPEAEWAAWGNFDREEFRFLYPFKQHHGQKLTTLWSFAHEGSQTAAAPKVTALEAALASKDRNEIQKQASRVISEWLELPASLGADHTATLWRAVADYEAQAFRGTAQPRLASLRLWAAMHSMKTRIPDGYSDAIRKAVPAKTFRELETHFDNWLALYPKHPLFDWVRLYKLRVYFLEGNDTAAWQVLLDLYPRRLPRVLGEMRYLLLMGRQPSSAQVDAFTDPVILTALANERTINPARFRKWWQLSTTAAAQPWAINLQERLLAWAARQKTLPVGFPGKPAEPSALWGKLRAVALAKTGRTADAIVQLRRLRADPEQARLLTSVYWRAGQPERAARVAQSNEDVLELVVRSELSTTALTRIIATPADPLRRSAARELSARLARQGKWAEAARFATQGDPSRKRLWSSAAQLATRPGGELALARFLVSNAGELFFKERSAFYRGLSTHYAGLPLGSKARANIDAAMTRGSARWIALELFTAWLEQHPNHPNARSVLAEADAQFVVLTNFGGGNYFYWGTIAQTSPVIKRLRRIGKLVRKP